MEPIRNKTLKRPSSAEPPLSEQAVEEQKPDPFRNLLDESARDAFRRPWHRLERGLRLNRIRLFIASEKTKLNLSDADADYLTNLLHKSLDKKLLNSKSAVVYNVEAQEIQEIKGLIYHTTSEGRVLSQIVEKKGVTFRKPHH